MRGKDEVELEVSVMMTAGFFPLHRYTGERNHNPIRTADAMGMLRCCCCCCK